MEVSLTGAIGVIAVRLHRAPAVEENLELAPVLNRNMAGRTAVDLWKKWRPVLLVEVMSRIIGTNMDSEGPDQTAHPRSLIRAFTVCLQNHWIL